MAIQKPTRRLRHVGEDAYVDYSERAYIQVANWFKNRVKEARKAQPSPLDAIIVDLVKRCLTIDPDKRPTAEEALSHRFMAPSSP